MKHIGRSSGAGGQSNAYFHPYILLENKSSSNLHRGGWQMGSAGAEVGDVSGRKRQQKQHSSLAYLHAGMRALQSPVWGKEEVLWIMQQKYSNSRPCLWFLAVWDEGCFSFLLIIDQTYSSHLNVECSFKDVAFCMEGVLDWAWRHRISSFIEFMKNFCSKFYDGIGVQVFMWNLLLHWGKSQLTWASGE